MQNTEWVPFQHTQNGRLTAPRCSPLAMTRQTSIRLTSPSRSISHGRCRVMVKRLLHQTAQLLPIRLHQGNSRQKLQAAFRCRFQTPCVGENAESCSMVRGDAEWEHAKPTCIFDDILRALDFFISYSNHLSRPDWSSGLRMVSPLALFPCTISLLCNPLLNA